MLTEREKDLNKKEQELNAMTSLCTDLNHKMSRLQIVNDKTSQKLSKTKLLSWQKDQQL